MKSLNMILGIIALIVLILGFITAPEQPKKRTVRVWIMVAIIWVIIAWLRL